MKALKLSQLVAYFSGTCAVTASIYLVAKHPLTKTAKEPVVSAALQQVQEPSKIQEANLKLREKARRLMELPETHEGAALKTLLRANNAIQSASEGKPEGRERVAAASAEIKVLQKRTKALGIKLPANLSQSLQQAQSELGRLSQGATNSSSGALVKVVTPNSSQNRLIMASTTSGKNLSLAQPSANILKPVMIRAASATPNRSTTTCTDINPVDPAASAALLGTDTYTARTSRLQALADQLQTPEAIFQFVQNSVQFSGSFGAGQTADQVLSSGSGTSADKASLLVALLRARNIPAVYMAGELQLTEA